MARARRNTPAPTYPCSNPDCDNIVAGRRKSLSGDHWCSESDCQAMKQRQLRAARKALETTQLTVDDERRALFHAALHLPRRKCSQCDLEDAVPGFLHRSAPGSREICYGTGNRGVAAGRLWIDLVHPDRVSA